LPELPGQKRVRFSNEYHLSEYDISVLTSNVQSANFFERLIEEGIAPKDGANWINGQLFSEMNARLLDWNHIPVTAEHLADLIRRVTNGEINLQTAKTTFGEMVETGKTSETIIQEKGLKQISDSSMISQIIQSVLKENSEEIRSYLAGKDTLAQWFFGQVMGKTRGQASPLIVKQELDRQLQALKDRDSSD
jgi:aspartyl-tRNA(Asn)/glutamyl-tRNA(Gln) amidotransferase subunit B